MLRVKLIKFDATHFIDTIRDMDISGDFVIAGSVALALHGVIHPDLPPVDLDIIMSEEAWDRNFRNLTHSFKSEITGDVVREYSFQKADGSVFHIEASKRWIAPNISLEEIFNAPKINGIRVFTKDMCERSMSYLDRPNDKKRLPLLRDQINPRFPLEIPAELRSIAPQLASCGL